MQAMFGRVIHYMALRALCSVAFAVLIFWKLDERGGHGVDGDPDDDTGDGGATTTDRELPWAVVLAPLVVSVRTTTQTHPAPPPAATASAAPPPPPARRRACAPRRRPTHTTPPGACGDTTPQPGRDRPLSFGDVARGARDRPIVLAALSMT